MSRIRAVLHALASLPVWLAHHIGATHDARNAKRLADKSRQLLHDIELVRHCEASVRRLASLQNDLGSSDRTAQKNLIAQMRLELENLRTIEPRVSALFDDLRPDRAWHSGVAQRAKGLFGLTSALLPARVVNEELGDALEDVHARIAAGRPHGEILLKIYASVFWALWHTVLYAVKGVTDALGRKGG